VRRVFRRWVAPTEVDAATGYDLWSSTYDAETENLLVILDEAMFQELLDGVVVRGRRVIDVGCGTGRHWKKIMAREPAALVGYDISSGMLAQLRKKHPSATVHRANADHLVEARDRACDLVVSTLALSHVPDVEGALREWARVLRPGGDILVTDFHPAAAASAGTTFRHEGRVVRVSLRAHAMAALAAAAERCGFEVLTLRETVLDDSMRHHYERAGLVHVFERMRGVPHLYGLHLRSQGIGA
jgi:ubiquinone/menaquinone biosynthesis C-methylase UbiE